MTELYVFLKKLDFDAMTLGQRVSIVNRSSISWGHLSEHVIFGTSYYSFRTTLECAIGSTLENCVLYPKLQAQKIINEEFDKAIFESGY